MPARTMPISPCYAETMLHARNWPWDRSNMQNFFDAFQPYSAQLKSGHFSYAIDCGLAFLNEVKRRAPAKYDTTPKGTPFYLLGIAALHAHDYQTATFLFDAAVSEDLQHNSGKPDQPALLFMRLEDQKQDQAALEIVKLAVKKLRAIIRDYNRRDGKEHVTLPEVRKYFLKYCLESKESHLRTLTTTFVSFLVEWDYRLKLIDLSKNGSREPFFTHLLRGCLLFESLLKMNPTEVVCKRLPLEALLKDPCLLKRLDIKRVKSSSLTLDQIVQSLVQRERMQAAIKCTFQTRNRLAHNLALEAKSLDVQKYDLLAKNIAASCLHAISRLYR